MVTRTLLYITVCVHCLYFTPDCISYFTFWLEQLKMSVKDVCEECVWGMCVWNVCEECVWGMFVRNVCEECVWGMCVWNVCEECVWGMCVRNVSGQCQTDILTAALLKIRAAEKWLSLGVWFLTFSRTVMSSASSSCAARPRPLNNGHRSPFDRPLCPTRHKSGFCWHRFLPENVLVD
jgi:hypothetical protein